jgi:dTDP-4-dehydrorhamnose reductase
MKKLLVIGGSGMLGSSLIAECNLKAIQVDAPKSSVLDIRSQRQVQNYVFNVRPTAIVNCAAWTDVENSEHEYLNACEMNATAVQNVAIAAKEIGVPVVHISTDYVFDGSKIGMYSEEDETNPINSYGRSKLLGERILLEVLPENSYLIRTSWLYGTNGKNFVKSILKKALNQERIQVVQDQVGSPTNSEDLARGIIAILQGKPLAGTYHFSNTGKISWYEFAVRIYELAGANTHLVEPVGSTAYPSKVKRPAHSVLSTEKWSKAEITKIVDWDKSLVQIFPRILESVRREAR